MKRINFYLTEYEIKCLREESEERGIATSDLLRRIIDEYFETESHYGNFHNDRFIISGNTIKI